MPKLVFLVVIVAFLSFSVNSEARISDHLGKYGETLKEGIQGLAKKVSDELPNWEVKSKSKLERNQHKTSHSSERISTENVRTSTKTTKSDDLKEFRNLNEDENAGEQGIQKEDISDQRNTKSDGFMEDINLEDTIDYASDFLSQTADSVLNILSRKGELKEFIKNTVESSKQMGGKFQDWKKAAEVFSNIQSDISMQDLQSVFEDFMGNSFDKAADAASETIKSMKQTFHRSATVMKSTLKDFEKVGNELMEETLEDLDEFFDVFSDNTHSDNHDEEETREYDMEEDDIREPVDTDSEDEPVTVDVTIDVSVKAKNGAQEEENPQAGKIEESAAKTEEKSEPNFHDCMEEVVKAGALNLHSKEGNINDFSVSCKSEQCRRCLLWLYVLSQKNYQQMQRTKEVEAPSA